jgi:hypothetical protein
MVKQLEIAQATFNPRRAQCRRLKLHDAEEVRQLRNEIQRLNRMVADREMQNEMLQEVAKGKW